ncbi:bifunctional diguanylate cyclase/phosphodiesterase [Massilia sp. Se16.2.3]|uniref:putative bifunctional diguanylate cyclase/phosphodiesterase n=1 Tax=Massilia sp. Se16.2.3 TaxID=2709303 RepID=UPI001E28D994|nr:GGDEF domain-containing phosphodiesterase [Massilia sp. Se16.2.3]
MSTNSRSHDASALSLDLLLRNLPGAVYRCLNDSHWTMEFLSAGVEKLTGYPAAAFFGEHPIAYASLIHPDDRAQVLTDTNQAVREGRPFQLSYRIITASGKLRWAWEQGSAVVDQDGNVSLEGFIADISALRRADLLAREQASLLDKAHDAIFVMDMHARITYWNKGAERLYGWEERQVLGQRMSDLLCDNHAAFSEALRTAIEEGEWAGELQQHRRDGTTIHADSRWTVVAGDPDTGVQQKILVISTDISERKINEERIHKLAYFDALTELPNRASLLDHLRRALLGSARSRKFGALMFLDLDNFKILNDTHGHAAGDMLLQAVARRLEHSVREADMVARLGGDEFVILVQPEEEMLEAAAHQAETVAAKVVAAMNAPFQLADFMYAVSTSVGVTMISGATDTVESALKQADTAMYQAKAAGRNTFRFFDPDMQAKWTARSELETGLRRALRNHEFILYYQPQLDGDSRVIGAEALLRWRQPNGELLYPTDFIKAAEETSLIVDIGRWVLGTACAELASWQGNPVTRHLSLSVNVSARQFVEPDFVPMTQEILAATGVDPHYLKFELTETLVVTDFAHTVETMETLRRLGITFSLDDFGTGYSSLAYLRKLPLDQLKIDYSFMRDVLTDRNDASIVRSIIALGDSLGLQVIAEGVETAGQRDFLSEAGCFVYQGYLYEPALSGERFTEYAASLH